MRNPFEVVKQQMQAGLHASTAQAVRSILRSEGVRGLYSGYGTLVAREIPFDAVQFVMYEWCKRAWAARAGRELSLLDNMAVGSLSGAVAASVTTPLDMVKTRLMTQTGLARELQYRGMLDGLRRVAAEEGVAALFAGLRTRVAWIGLGGAIFFGAFEESKRRLDAVLGHAPE